MVRCQSWNCINPDGPIIINLPNKNSTEFNNILFFRDQNGWDKFRLIDNLEQILLIDDINSFITSIINSRNKLGIKFHSRCRFCYKRGSNSRVENITYLQLCKGLHDKNKDSILYKLNKDLIRKIMLFVNQ